LGSRPRSIEDLYEQRAKATQRQYSIVKPETDAERRERLLLNDATRAVSTLLQLRGLTAGQDDRRKLMSEAAEIARDAVERVKSGKAFRGDFVRARRQAEIKLKRGTR